MPREYVEAPTPILTVLNAALHAIAQDKRFSSVPGGNVEVSWCQPTKTKGNERPERYKITVEVMFTEALGA